MLALATGLSMMSVSVAPASAAILLPPPTTTAVNLPPQPAIPGATLSVFPSRDFITTLPVGTASGYPAGSTYTVNVIRNGTAIGSATTTNPDAGINHPGGSCWDVQTPDIRPGDIVRITDHKGVANQTVVQDVSTQAPIIGAQGDLVIHGTAASAGGNPVAVGGQFPAGQLESRVLAPKTLLFSNGRRDIRAGGPGKDGILTYDPIDPVANPFGTNWTAVYNIQAHGGVLTPGDVALATDPGAQPRIHWLGANPASLAETTIWELPGAGRGIQPGPQAPCLAALQTGPSVGLAPAPGAYHAAQSVVITSSDPAALINFTTNGTTPASTGGTAGPITVPINGTATLKVLANNPTTAALSQLASGTYVIDTIAPVATIALSGTRSASGFYRSSVTASISASDTGGSGLASLQYTLDGGPATDIASGKSFPVPGDGTHTLSATATDLAGNVSAPVSQTFIIDTVAPSATVALSGTVGNPGFYRSAVTATVNATDNAGGSGVSTYVYVLDNGAPSVSATPTFTVSAPGNHQLIVSVTDAAGNTSTPVSTSFVIDLTPPALLASPAGGTFTSGQSITLQATDALATTIFYTLDGTPPGDTSAVYSTPIPVSQSLTLSSVARDAAGNLSASRSDVYTIAPPVVVPVAPSPAPAVVPVTPPAAPAVVPNLAPPAGGGGGGGGGGKPAASGGSAGSGGSGGGGVSLAPAGNVPFLAPAVGEPPMIVPPASSPIQPTEAQPRPDRDIDVNLVSTPLAPATVPAGPATLAIDPALGGTLSTTDGTLSVVVPPGASAESLTLSLSHLVEVGQANGNLSLGNQMFLVTLSTPTGEVLSAFDPPLVVTIRPSSDAVASANGDLSGLAMMALDPDSGSFQVVASSVNADGTITASLARLGMPAPAPTSTPAAEAPDADQSQAILDDVPPIAEEAALDLGDEIFP